MAPPTPQPWNCDYGLHLGRVKWQTALSRWDFAVIWVLNVPWELVLKASSAACGVIERSGLRWVWWKGVRSPSCAQLCP